MRSHLFRRLALVLVLGLSAGASAQSPAGPPGKITGPLPEPFDGLAEARGGSTLTSVGAWPYGPTYGVAVTEDGTVVSGQGRVLHVRRPGGSTQDLVMPGLIRDVAVRNGVAYVATSHATLTEARGLFVVSLAPGAAAIVGSLTGGTVAGIDLAAGTTAYVTRFSPTRATYTLAVVDVADLAAPTLVGEADIAGFAPDVAHLGTTVYVAGGSGGVYVVDAAVPSAPVLVRALEVGLYDRGVAVDAVSVPARLAVASGDYAAGNGTVTAFSLAAPLAPALTRQYTSPTVVEDVAWAPGSGPPLYASASNGGVIGLDDALQPVTFSAFPPDNIVFGSNRLALATVAGALTVYAADYYYGVVRYDRFLTDAVVADAGRSFSFGTIADSADPTRVYVAAGAYGVARLRASADGRLAQTGRAHDAAWNYTYAVAQTAAYLYVADGFSGVHVVSKATMARVRTLPVEFTDNVVVSEDGQMLLVKEGTALTAFSLADPTDPSPEWSVSDLDPETVASARGALYVGQASGSDVSVLETFPGGFPLLRATLPTAGSNVAVVLDGPRLYAYGGPTQVSVFDASTPTAPVLIGTVSTSGGAGFDVRGGIVYVGGAAGLQAVDARDPSASVPLASYNAGRAGAISGVTAADGTVYLAEGSVGVERIAAMLTVAGEAAPARAEALTVAPNPTSRRASVTFTLAEAGDVTADVFDALGRRVARLASGLAPAGLQTLVWDGRSENGSPAAAGVYLVRVSAAGAVRSACLTVVR